MKVEGISLKFHQSFSANLKEDNEPKKDPSYDRETVRISPEYYQAIFKLSQTSISGKVQNWLNNLNLDTLLDSVDFDKEVIFGSNKPKDTTQDELKEVLFEYFGDDFSNLDKKLSTILLTKYMAFYKFVDEEDTYQDIFESAKDDEGKIDLDLILDSYRFMNTDIFPHNPKDTVGLFKKYSSKDDREDVSEVMCILNSGYYNFATDEYNFERLMDLCYTAAGQNRKFDRRKARTMLQTLNYVETCLDKEITRNKDWHKDVRIFFDSEEYSAYEDSKITKIFRDCTKLGADLIVGYFSENSRQDGRLYKYPKSFQDYVKEYAK